jgi:DNA-binding response OmpR family regulator
MALSLSSLHYREVIDSQVRTEFGQENLFEFVTTPVEGDEQRFRVIEIPDKGRAKRAHWIRQILRGRDWHVFRVGSSAYLSQSLCSFDFVLISGDDEARVSNLVRELRRLLPSKIVVAVVQTSNGPACADLLKRGASDVLDCGMEIEEGICRLRSLARRNALAIEEEVRSSRSALGEALKIARMCSGALTPKEERLMSALMSRPGRIVPYWSICRTVSVGYNKISSERSIYVSIHNLRKKLVSGVQILNMRGSGYVLTTDTSRSRDRFLT